MIVGRPVRPKSWDKRFKFRKCSGDMRFKFQKCSLKLKKLYQIFNIAVCKYNRHVYIYLHKVVNHQSLKFSKSLIKFRMSPNRSKSFTQIQYECTLLQVQLKIYKILQICLQAYNQSKPRISRVTTLSYTQCNNFKCYTQALLLTRLPTYVDDDFFRKHRQEYD